MQKVDADPGHSHWYVERFRSMARDGEDLVGEARLVEVGHLPFTRSVCIHHPNLQDGWTYQILFEQRDVIRLFFFRLRMISAIDDPLAVVRPEWPAIIAKFIRQPLHMLSISIHRIDIQITIALRSEYELAVVRDRCFRIIAGRVCQLLQIRSARIRREDIEGVIYGPNVAL